MTVTPTTPDERRLLMSAGFVHATGLIEYGNMGYQLGSGCRAGDLGTFTPADEDSGNPPVQLLITTGGEHWVSSMPSNQFESEQVQAVVKQFCPNGEGMGRAPGDNGTGSLEWTDVLHRVANPDWIPDQ